MTIRLQAPLPSAGCDSAGCGLAGTMTVSVFVALPLLHAASASVAALTGANVQRIDKEAPVRLDHREVDCAAGGGRVVCGDLVVRARRRALRPSFDVLVRERVARV